MSDLITAPWTAEQVATRVWRCDVSRCDPFIIEEPALISFSGGRTSAYMLRRILDAHGNVLPEHVHVFFANTGKEREETLDFVRDCATAWSVPITWVEYDGVDLKTRRARVKYVTHETASRAGEPFRKIIEHRRYLPGPALRFCTQELKLRPLKWAMVARGYDNWTSIVGLRADEMHRVHRVHEKGHDRGATIAPLSSVGVTELDVLSWWARQTFNLRLLPHEGNCDLCPLKAQAKRLRIMRENPQLAAWWIEQERWARSIGATSDRFRPGEIGYGRALDYALRSPMLPMLNDVGGGVDCSCTD